jgi:hypothetical protein
MTDRAILDHISSLPHARATFKQLVRELGAKGATRAELEAALARLTGARRPAGTAFRPLRGVTARTANSPSAG